MMVCRGSQGGERTTGQAQSEGFNRKWEGREAVVSEKAKNSQRATAGIYR